MNDQQFNNNPYPPSPGFQPMPEADVEPRQSKLGVASFILGLVSIIGFIASIIILFVTAIDIFGEFPDPAAYDEIESGKFLAGVILPVLLMFFFIAVSIVGLILGIVGVCTKYTRKAFSIIGIVLNGLLSVGFLIMFIMGALSQAVAGG